MNSILYSLTLFAQAAPNELTDEDKFAIAAAAALILFIVFCVFVFYNVLLLISFFAFRRKQGFWGNAICAMNISFATIITISFYESLASILSDLYAGLLFYYEYLTFMILFVFSYSMLAMFTNRLSKVKLRFPVPIEVGGNIVAILCCYVSFLGMIHAATVVAPVGITEVAAPPPAVIQVSLLSQGPLQPIFMGDVLDTDDYVDRLNVHHAAHNENAEKGNSLYDGSAPPKAE